MFTSAIITESYAADPEQKGAPLAAARRSSRYASAVV
jgi:hypothetical protein